MAGSSDENLLTTDPETFCKIRRYSVGVRHPFNSWFRLQLDRAERMIGTAALNRGYQEAERTRFYENRTREVARRSEIMFRDMWRDLEWLRQAKAGLRRLEASPPSGEDRGNNSSSAQATVGDPDCRLGGRGVEGFLLRWKEKPGADRGVVLSTSSLSTSSSLPEKTSNTIPVAMLDRVLWFRPENVRRFGVERHALRKRVVKNRDIVPLTGVTIKTISFCAGRSGSPMMEKHEEVSSTSNKNLRFSGQIPDLQHNTFLDLRGLVPTNLRTGKFFNLGTGSCADDDMFWPFFTGAAFYSDAEKKKKAKLMADRTAVEYSIMWNGGRQLVGWLSGVSVSVVHNWAQRGGSPYS